MANCSTPNSTQATGRISTRSSRPSRKQSNASASAVEVLNLARQARSWISRVFNVQLSTLNAQRPIQKFGHWTLDVGRWAFSSFGRVKGAWWPSRSSKPSSPRKWRGRFDSYPLRQNQLRIGECRLRIAGSCRPRILAVSVLGNASNALIPFRDPQWERG